MSVESNPREQSILALLKIFKSYSGIEDRGQALQKLQEDQDFYVCPHPKESISIITYRHNHNKKHASYEGVCRGLVIDNHSWNIVSRGFDRFFAPTQITPNSQSCLQIKRATIKEDGSLIFLFRYKNNWHLSTIHNFADDVLPYSSETYQQLFLQIVNCNLNEFAQKLIGQLGEIGDQVMTICFEMCSVYNQVIRRYDSPTLFLLAIFGGDHGSSEYSIPDNLVLPPNVKVVTKIDFPEQLQLKDITAKITEMSRSDLTFEGLVIETTAGIRHKVKNPNYIIQHRLKYRGWVTATPQLMVPLIIEGRYSQILKNVIQSIGGLTTNREGGDKTTRDEIEIELRHKHYFQEINSIECHFIQVFNSVPSNTVLTRSEFISHFTNLDMNKYTRLIDQLWKIWCHNPKCDENKLSACIRRHILENIERIFPIVDPMCNWNHAKHCGYSSTIENLSEPNDGLAKEPNFCYCGQPMKTVRLRRDLLRYRICYHGIKCGILKYPSGSLLQVCSNSDCECTHEVNQKTGKPLGIPASILCKNLRLQVHDKINYKIKNSAYSRSQCYEEISKITGRQPDTTHMALMGISECVKVLSQFN